MLRITKTENGMVQGCTGRDARITVFKGIPYAANTSGDNRWRAPQPAENWEGIRECFEFAPISMQKIPGINPDAFYSKEWHVDPEIPMSEDGSLVVNVWTPAKTGKEKLPVMAWIFGGGLHEGYAHEMEFDGERMASRGVVLVTINYRLNAFGLLAHPDLTAEDPEHPTNFAYLDQLAGLKWIQRNIENFGGDPTNVTLFGQSAGGISVFTHLGSPETEGLFQRVIIESSAGGAMVPACPWTPFGEAVTLKEAEEFGARFLKDVLGVDTIAEARKIPAEVIRDKYLAAKVRFPVPIDGKFQVDTITGTVVHDKLHKLPVMIGYTEDEMPMGVVNGTEEEITAWAEKNFGENAAEYMAACREKAEKEGKTLAQVALVNPNEISNRIAAEIMSANGHTVYTYAFDPEMPGDNAGSFHSSDLWFQFETLMHCWRPFDGHHYDLARKMCNYWTNYAKTGDPNGVDADGTPMVKWEPYTHEYPCSIRFYDEISVEPAVFDDKKRNLLMKLNTAAFMKK